MSEALRRQEISLADLRDFRAGDGSEKTCFLADEAVIATRISTGRPFTVLQLNVNYHFPGLAARIAAVLNGDAPAATDPTVWDLK